MAKEETVKVKCIVEQCKASGERLKKGKTYDISPSDARVLVAYKSVEYVDKQKQDKGLSTESMKQK